MNVLRIDNYLRLTLSSIVALNRYIKIIKDCYDFQMSTFEMLKKKTANMESNAKYIYDIRLTKINFSIVFSLSC